MTEKAMVLIPITMNSKRIENKSLKLLNGKPMFEYVLDEAIKFHESYRSEIILSSEDDVFLWNTFDDYYGRKDPDALQNANLGYLGSFRCLKRPQYLAEDPYQLVDVIQYTIQQIETEEYTTIILLQVDNPLILTEDIEGCYEKFLQNDRKTVCTVVKEEPSESAYHSYTMKDEVMNPLFMGLETIPDTYKRTGGVVVCDMQTFVEKQTHLAFPMIGYEIPKERAVNVDTEYDLKVVEMLLGER